MPVHSSPALRRAMVSAAVSAALLASLGAVRAETIIGLTNNALVMFDSASPGTTTTPVAITGLQAGATLLGIDLRPTTDVLYGVANDGSVYTINATTGAAALIGSVSGGIPAGPIGIDFNPVPDLAGAASLRITTATSNLRINVNSGAFATTVDTAINGATTFLAGLAYTNNDRDPATATSLFGIGRGNLYQVTVPNAGTSIFIGSLGPSVLAADGFTAFDVSGVSGAAFAALSSVAGVSSFYSINLGTGAPTLIGAIGPNAGSIRGITATTQALAPAIPEPQTYAMLMLGLGVVGWVARRRRS